MLQIQDNSIEGENSLAVKDEEGMQTKSIRNY